MDVRARIDLQLLAQRMTSDAGRPYDTDSAAGFLRGAGCRADGQEWVVPLIVLGALRPEEIRIIKTGDGSQAS